MAEFSSLQRQTNYDWLGLTAGMLCAIHCALTPFLVVLVPVLTESGGWWGMLDVVFLLVSLVAVKGAVRTNSPAWVRTVAPIGWILLALGLAAERYGITGSDYVMYLGAAGLLVAHLGNIRHCGYCRRCEMSTANK